MLDELGASPKETQELMRHATPMLTMQRYVQARFDRRQRLVEDMANVIWGARDPGGGNGRRRNYLENQRLTIIGGSGGGGNRT